MESATVKYPLAERFIAPQGEGMYTGTVMGFIRFVGCSVGKNICHNCDTDFEVIHVNQGGGLYTIEEIVAWVTSNHLHHVCFTGGEPLDRNLGPLVDALLEDKVLKMIHVETSGTKPIPAWLYESTLCTWLAISPKPGYLEDVVKKADEIKVILGGLGDGVGWPGIKDALNWERKYNIPVYIQPNNGKHQIDVFHMHDAVEVVMKYPQLRLSAQLHKYINTR